MGKGKRRQQSKEEQDGEKDKLKKELVNGVDVNWHNGKEFRDGLKQFHNNSACQPDRTKVNVINRALQAKLEQKLREKEFRVKIEYTGSSFEGTKVPKADDDPDFEFDMLFVIDGGDQLQKAVDLDPKIPGFVYLEPNVENTNKRKHWFDKYLVNRVDNKGNILSADKFLLDFQVVLAECINEIGEIRTKTELDLHTDYLIKLRRHGPAIQMDVYLTVGDKVLGEMGQRDGTDEAIEGATGDDNIQCINTRMENNCEGGLEGQKGEGGILKENERSQDEIENSTEDASEEAILETREEADAKSDQDTSVGTRKGNSKEFRLKFRLAEKNKTGRKELSKLKRLYSVDVVPTLHVPSADRNRVGEYYVAKPVKAPKAKIEELKSVEEEKAHTEELKSVEGEKAHIEELKPVNGEKVHIEELKSAWRRSFSLDAKNMLKCADSKITCKKMVFRIFKAMRNRESGLEKMNTYHLKNALLKELDGPTDINEGGKDWSMNALAERFMDVLERLIREYAPGQKMSEYFIKEIDLLEHMKESTRENIYYRLKRLRNSQKQMMRILEGRKPRKRRPQKTQAITEHA